MRDLFTSQNQAFWQEYIQKEAAARVAWKLNYGHKYPKERPGPRKRLQQAPCRSALGVGPLPVTSFPDSKEVRVGPPETKGVCGQLSREVDVQGPPPKEDRVWEAKRATWGPAGQTKPEGLGMRQVPPSTLQLLFQGISHDGQGRALYLRERHRQKPEEKFQYPILSSWEYGWHVGKGHHHLAIPDLCRQALPPSQAPCFITPHQQHITLAQCSPSRPSTFTLPGLCTFWSTWNAPPAPLPLLVNIHVTSSGKSSESPPGRFKSPLCFCGFRVCESTGSTVSPFFEYFHLVW